MLLEWLTGLRKKDLSKEKTTLKTGARVVHLTAKGEKLVKKAWELHATDLEKLTASLSEKERKDVMQVLRQLTQNAAALLEEPKKSQLSDLSLFFFIT